MSKDKRERLAAVEALPRWFRQIQTPCADLTESEKNSDREWTGKVLESTGTASPHTEVDYNRARAWLKNRGEK